MDETGQTQDERDQAAEQIRAAGKLAGDGMRGLLGIVRDSHEVIARRVAEQLPAGHEPVTAAEREISSAVYGLIGAAQTAASTATAQAAADALPADAVPPSSTAAGAAAQAAVNAFWGDRIAAGAPALAVPMAVRIGGRNLPLDADSVAAAFPRAGADLVLFVHGLAEDERAWTLSYEDDRESYADRLERDFGFSALAVRYNTGLHISENGQLLGELIDALTAVWPVPVRSLSLVGHSMGGLVARSAVHLAAERGAGWVPSLRAVISLGSPHLGAPMEKAANVLDRALRLAPETEPYSRALAARSVGIKDLRYGAILSEDWDGHDPDEFLTNRTRQVPLLPAVAYYWVSSTLTADPEHPMGVLLGDGLVRSPSASGQGAHSRIGFPMESGVSLGSVSHLRLLNHPAVYEQLVVWLGAAAQSAAGSSQARQGGGDPVPQ